MLHSFRSLLALAVLLLPTQSLAIGVSIDITSGSAPGISFSSLHSADKAPATIGNNEFLRGGIDKFALSGTLTGDLTGTALTIDAGTITVAGAADIIVISGSIVWPGLDPDAETNEFIGSIETANYGTFHFFDNQSVISASAQTLTATADGHFAILWGNNWTGPIPGQLGDLAELRVAQIPNLGMDLGLDIRPTPEAGSALLLMSGLAGLTLFGRRR